MRSIAIGVLAALLMCGGCSKDKTGVELSGPAEVVRDPDGIAHIYATTDEDAFAIQGFVTASDRMFQMDMLRRRAQGRRAEILGEAFYRSDLQSRAIGFRRIAA